MSKNPIKEIGALILEEEVDMFVLAKSVIQKTTRNNDPYINFELCDKTGSVPAKMWNTSLEALPGVEKDKVIKVRGSLKPNGSLPNHFVITIARVATDKDVYDREAFSAMLDKPEQAVAVQTTPDKPAEPIDHGERVRKKIKDLVVGDRIEMFALIKIMNQKEDRKGRPFVNFEFQDNVATVDGKLWETGIDVMLEAGIDQGSLVFVTGMVDSFNDRRQVKVESIRLVTPDDATNEADFYAVAPLVGLTMYERIMAYVDTWKNEDLKKLVKYIYEKRKEELTYFPAALVVHHAEKGGLLFHTYQMLRAGRALGHIYFDDLESILPDENDGHEPNGDPSEHVFDSELLETGILLHDIGKPDEMDSDEHGIVREYTKKGMLLGHMIMGNDIVTEAAKELGINEELTLLVKHMIISHHFDEKMGAYVKPQTVEADILHHLDMIDSKVYQFKKILEKLQKGTFSESRSYLEGRKLYRPLPYTAEPDSET